MACPNKEIHSIFTIHERMPGIVSLWGTGSSPCPSSLPDHTLKGTLARPSFVPLDDLARKILLELAKGPQTADALSTKYASGASRMTSPRLVWLEGLGMIENLGSGSYGITDTGRVFIEVAT